MPKPESSRFEEFLKYFGLFAVVIITIAALTGSAMGAYAFAAHFETSKKVEAIIHFLSQVSGQ